MKEEAFRALAMLVLIWLLIDGCLLYNYSLN